MVLMVDGVLVILVPATSASLATLVGTSRPGRMKALKWLMILWFERWVVETLTSLPLRIERFAALALRMTILLLTRLKDRAPVCLVSAVQELTINRGAFDEIVLLTST